MVKDKSYWQKRFEDLKETQMHKAESVNDDLKKAYKDVLEKVRGDVAKWYQRFSKDNQVTLAEANKALSPSERKRFAMELEDYRKLAKENSELIALKNASTATRLTRMEMLYLDTVKYMEQLAERNHKELEGLLRDVYEDSYYKTAYETQSMQGEYKSVDGVPTKTIDTALKKPWAPDGKNFSERIWQDRAKLAQNLYREISQSLLLKEGVHGLTQRLMRAYGNSYNNTRRLVETETAYIHEKASQRVMDELGCESVEILATLDSRTSPICRKMDGKIVAVKDIVIGVTVPPFHCYCRSTTIPYIEGIDDAGERVARDYDTGETVKVRGDLKYNEWYNKYIKEGSKLYELEEAEKEEKQRIKEDKKKVSEKLKELKMTGTLIYPPKVIDLTGFEFDDKHINEDRVHNVTRDEAIEFMLSAEFALKRNNGKYLNFYSQKGCTYINIQDMRIATSYKSEEFSDKVYEIMRWFRDDFRR